MKPLSKSLNKLSSSLEKPSAPEKPNIDEIYAQSCDLSWVAPSSDGGAAIERYVVEVKESSDRKWLSGDFHDNQSPSLSNKVVSLRPEVEYVFRVAAVNKAGQGPFSEPSDSKKYRKY